MLQLNPADLGASMKRRSIGISAKLAIFVGVALIALSIANSALASQVIDCPSTVHTGDLQVAPAPPHGWHGAVLPYIFDVHGASVSKPERLPGWDHQTAILFCWYPIVGGDWTGGDAANNGHYISVQLSTNVWPDSGCSARADHKSFSCRGSTIDQLLATKTGTEPSWLAKAAEDEREALKIAQCTTSCIVSNGRCIIQAHDSAQRQMCIAEQSRCTAACKSK